MTTIEASAHELKKRKKRERERREDARFANNGSDMRVNDASQRCAQFFLILNFDRESPHGTA